MRAPRCTLTNHNIKHTTLPLNDFGETPLCVASRFQNTWRRGDFAYRDTTVLECFHTKRQRFLCLCYWKKYFHLVLLTWPNDLIILFSRHLSALNCVFFKTYLENYNGNSEFFKKNNSLNANFVDNITFLHLNTHFWFIKFT